MDLFQAGCLFTILFFIGIPLIIVLLTLVFSGGAASIIGISVILLGLFAVLGRAA